MSRTFFKIVTDGVTQQSYKQQPFYIYGIHKDGKNIISIIVSPCDKNCWAKEDLKDWQKLEVECSLASDAKSKIYNFKNHLRLKKLEIPFSIEDNVQLTEHNKPFIAMDRFRAEQGELKNYPHIAGIVFSRLPFDKEAQRKLVLEEKKQSINKALQYLESIKNSLQQSLENVDKLSSELSSELSSVVRELSMLIGFVIEKCERSIQQLNEQYDSLEPSAAESASAVATLKI